MAITAVIGGQWGDEGKGKIVDLLSRDANMVARFQGGANAGHTVYKGDLKIILHQVPSGILTKNCQCVLGNGMVIDPVDLVQELTIVPLRMTHLAVQYFPSMLEIILIQYFYLSALMGILILIMQMQVGCCPCHPWNI